jgi:hypothetical protein
MASSSFFLDHLPRQNSRTSRSASIDQNQQVLESTNSTKRLQHDSQPKKRGLHRTGEELQATLDAFKGKSTATSQDLPSSTAMQSAPRKGLHRTHDEHQAKMQAKFGSTSAAARHLLLDGAARKKGSHRTGEERQAKLDSVKGKCTATSQAFAHSTVVQSLPHLPGKGLHRTPEERETKIRALLGSTWSNSTAKNDNNNDCFQSSTGSATDPPSWLNASNLLDEEQSQESSAMESDLNQDNNSNDEWLSPLADMPAASQYLNSDLNPTLGGTLLSPLIARLPLSSTVVPVSLHLAFNYGPLAGSRY